jgi:hypothetical protein
MKKDCFRWISFAWFALMAGLPLPARIAWAKCYTAPQIAIDSLSSRSALLPFDEVDGYRVVKIQVDPILGRRWATVVRCGHPEAPMLSLPVADGDYGETAGKAKREFAGNETRLLVRAGERVRLWWSDRSERIELAGISEESGGEGRTIRVRLLRGGLNDPSQPKEISGVVRGEASVEMLR